MSGTVHGFSTGKRGLVSALAVLLLLTLLPGAGARADPPLDISEPITTLDAVVPSVLVNSAGAASMQVEVVADDDGAAVTAELPSEGAPPNPDSAPVGTVHSVEISIMNAEPEPTLDAGEFLVLSGSDSGAEFHYVRGTAAGMQILTAVDARPLVPVTSFELSSKDDGAPLELQVLEDGTVEARNAGGDLVGTIARPWAVDANGRAVATSFEVSGGVLRQTVDYSDPSIEYPVISDPEFSYARTYVIGGESSITIAKIRDAYMNCFSCFFGAPVFTGAPTSMPAVGTTIPLRLMHGGSFSVTMNAISYNASIENFSFSLKTRSGHFFGPDAIIGFTFYRASTDDKFYMVIEEHIVASERPPSGLHTVILNEGYGNQARLLRAALVSPSTTTTYVDVTSSTTGATQINAMTASGVVSGWALPSGRKAYQPTLPVLRADMARQLFRLAGSPAYTAPTVSPFADIATSSPYYRELAWLAESGLVTLNSSGNFGPYNESPRANMAVYLYRFADRYAAQPVQDFVPPTTSPFVDVPTSHPYYRSITWAYANGVFTGYGSAPNLEFRPDALVTRAAMAGLLYRLDALPKPPVECLEPGDNLCLEVDDQVTTIRPPGSYEPLVPIIPQVAPNDSSTSDLQGPADADAASRVTEATPATPPGECGIPGTQTLYRFYGCVHYRSVPMSIIRVGGPFGFIRTVAAGDAETYVWFTASATEPTVDIGTQVTVRPRWGLWSGVNINTQVTHPNLGLTLTSGTASASVPVTNGAQASTLGTYTSSVQPDSVQYYDPALNVHLSQPSRGIVGPTAHYGFTEWRCDDTSAEPVEDGPTPSVEPGCVITDAERPQLIFLASRYEQLAQHLTDSIASGAPMTLTRTTDSSQRVQNRNTACPRTFTRPNGYQCDEYPFASTIQGAASASTAGRTFDFCQITDLPTGVTGTGWSACMVPSGQNSTHGGDLSTGYSRYRIVDGENFDVVIQW